MHVPPINPSHVLLQAVYHLCSQMSSSNNLISYNTAEAYWSNVEPSVDGMLGGFAHLAPIDVSDSVKVLRVLKDEVGLGSWLIYDTAQFAVPLIYRLRPRLRRRRWPCDEAFAVENF